MKFDELNKKTKEELKKLLQDSKNKSRELNFDLVSGRVKNIREIRQLKKDIARVLTILKD